MANALVDLKVEVVSKEGSIQFSNYEGLKANINATLSKYEGLILTDDNKQFIKGEKANLNKVSKALNDERIAVKKEYVKPLELFEEQVKEITGLIKDVTNKLDEQVKVAEDAEKQLKEDNVRFYFDELKLANPSIDFITFEDVNLNVTLSVSEKKLKEEVKAFVDQILLDLEEITTDPNASRLLAKYKLSKNLQQSRIALNRELQMEATIDVPQTPHVAPEPTQAPQVAPVVEEVITIEFTVTTTKSKLIALKEYLEKEGITYE